MDIEAAKLVEPSAAPDRGSDIPGAAGLSVLQREWARNFVLTGGNSLKAAILAGYSEKSAKVSAYKNSANPQVMSYVQALCVSNVKAHLPMAIGELVRLIANPETDDRAKVQAIFGLMDRAGMAAPKGGPTLAVQVNVNGQQVQALIREVWEKKAHRESDIDGGMSDISQGHTIDGDASERPALEAPAADPQGGVRPQGPAARVVPIPPPFTAHAPKTTGGQDAETMFD